MYLTNKVLKLLFVVGQSGNHRPVRRAASILLMFSLALGGVGCGSIYHRSRALLPPDPFIQLELRVDEAHRAEKLAQQAGARLREGFKQGLDKEAIGLDVDRVETAAFEFERRVASAMDAAQRCKEQTRLAGELERLGLRSRDLMNYVQSLRRADPSATAALLDNYLRGSAKP